WMRRARRSDWWNPSETKDAHAEAATLPRERDVERVGRAVRHAEEGCRAVLDAADVAGSGDRPQTGSEPDELDAGAAARAGSIGLRKDRPGRIGQRPAAALAD